MPTKEIKRQARGLVEALEVRVHAGPPVCETEIQSVRDFLQQNEFSRTSDYFLRLGSLKNRVQTHRTTLSGGKRNYGGEASGCWMQLQSIYDHLILSTCHEGDFNLRHGRVKISHRFNQAGRIDFVELKFLRSLEPCLTGAVRKMVTIRNYSELRQDWLEAEAFALRVLPRELIFLYGDIFRCSRTDVLAWLINIGHRIASDLLASFKAGTVNGSPREIPGHLPQLPLKSVVEDTIAWPILQQAASLESTIEAQIGENYLVRYVHK